MKNPFKKWIKFWQNNKIIKIKIITKILLMMNKVKILNQDKF